MNEKEEILGGAAMLRRERDEARGDAARLCRLLLGTPLGWLHVQDAERMQLPSHPSGLMEGRSLLPGTHKGDHR